MTRTVWVAVIGLAFCVPLAHVNAETINGTVVDGDAPSGTALWLAGAIAEGRGVELEEKLVLERAGEIGARPPGAIGVQTLRGGDSPGEHSVLFVGPGERLELHHRSHTRDHFARGAVRAACWLVGRKPGLYRIEQVLGL